MSTRARLSWCVVVTLLAFNAFAAAAPHLEPASEHMNVREVVNGKLVCRLATPDEARAFARTDVPLRVMYPEPGSVRLSTGLQITLLATAQLEANPTAKAAFIRAAQTWEARISNPVSVTIKADFGTSRFGTPYPSPNILGSANGAGYYANYPAVRGALVARADNASETNLYNQLPSGTVPTNLGPAARVIGSTVQLKTLGFTLPADAIPDIGFNSAFPFDFDPSNGITPGTTDFDAVAVHEMGHILGFSSFVGTTELDPESEVSPTIWDLFRFRPGVSLATFQTAQRPMTSGGEHISFYGAASIPMSTGRPDGEGGDGQQASHWKDDAQTGVLIGLMDPTAPEGRGTLTQNDLDAFAAMGYNVTGGGTTPGTPVPAAPTNLSVAMQSATVAGLTWTDNATNETGYVVEIRVNSGAYTALNPLAANTTSATVSPLQAGNTYTFRVKARNAAGDSAPSNEASVTPGSGPSTCTPSSTTVCLVGGRFRVNIAYRNQFANPPTTGNFVAARLNPAATSPDTALFGFASANDVEVVVRIVDARPFAPRFDIYYGGLTDVEYTVSVTDTVTGASRQYKNNPGQVGGGVDRSTFPASAFGAEERLVSGGHDSFAIPPSELYLMPGTVVRAHKNRVPARADGLSLRTPVSAALTGSIGGGGACSESEPNEMPNQADDLALGAPCTGTVDDDDAFSITVTYPNSDSDTVEDLFKIVLPSPAKVNVVLETLKDDLDLFLFSISGSSITVIDNAASTNLTETFTTDETLPAGTYYVGVSAYDGSSSYTVTATGVGLATTPAAPTNLTATLTSSTQVRLNWTDNATNETGYVIEVKVNGGAYQAVPPTAPANTITATVSPLQAGNTYTFRVKATNAAGSSAYSNEASVTTGSGPSTCTPSSSTVCLNGSRFRVTINYRNQFANPPTTGNFVAARLNPSATNPDTALFGFANANDVEVVVRIVDARPFAPRFDIYYGGLTDVEYTVNVTDTVTGQTRQYKNNPGQVGGGVDRSSFPAN